jgi:hypothetical protein
MGRPHKWSQIDQRQNKHQQVRFDLHKWVQKMVQKMVQGWVLA